MNSLSKKIHSLQIFQQKNNINKKKLKMEPIIHHHELENPSIKKIVLLPLLQPLHIDVPFKDLCSANNQIFLYHLQLNLLRLLLLTWRPWIMARSFEVFNSLDVEKGGGELEEYVHVEVSKVETQGDHENLQIKFPLF